MTLHEVKIGEQKCNKTAPMYKIKENYKISFLHLMLFIWKILIDFFKNMLQDLFPIWNIYVITSQTIPCFNQSKNSLTTIVIHQIDLTHFAVFQNSYIFETKVMRHASGRLCISFNNRYRTKLFFTKIILKTHLQQYVPSCTFLFEISNLLSLTNPIFF